MQTERFDVIIEVSPFCWHEKYYRLLQVSGMFFFLKKILKMFQRPRICLYTLNVYALYEDLTPF